MGVTLLVFTLILTHELLDFLLITNRNRVVVPLERSYKEFPSPRFFGVLIFIIILFLVSLLALG
jgi:hypothetical protein